MRNMMITMIGEDFVLMAVAKGLPRRKVIWHAARNAVLPSVANLSLAIGLVDQVVPDAEVYSAALDFAFGLYEPPCRDGGC